MAGDRPARAREPWSLTDLGLLVPFVLGGLFVSRGRTVAGGVLVVVGLVVLVLRLTCGDLVPRTTERIAHASQKAITWVAVAGFWVLVVIPGWLLRKLGRADRKVPPSTTSMWVGSEREGSDKRSFAAPPHHQRRPASLVLSAIGLVVILMAIDSTIGLAWEGFTRSKLTAPVATRVGLSRNGTYHDFRADTPALSSYPWADEHLRDMQHLPQAYWPFELGRPLPFKSDTVTIDGWSRRSHEPAAAKTDEDLPVVAFYGGSTTFGEGQRDDHTIASEVSKLAEAAGTPIRVINYGQRSWTAWQEAMLFEQLSSKPDDPDQPDVVVFYDGANEVLQQKQDSTAGWPTHFAVDGIAKTLTGTHAGGSSSKGLSQRSLADDVTDWYVSHSMTIRALRGLRRATGFEPPPPAPFTSNRPQKDIGEDAAAVYLRARTFVEDTAERRGIHPVFYWQPMQDQSSSNESFLTATRLVKGNTIHIEDALDDHPEVYFDQVHTNEVGAKVVAARIWETLKDEIPRER